MTVAIPDAIAVEIVAVLRGAGARFGLLHGSRAAGSPRADSDVDVAAWWPSDLPPAFEVLLSPGVDLVVLNGAPLELAGRIALSGRILFDDDPAARVRWTATTRKIYADEQPRLLGAHGVLSADLAGRLCRAVGFWNVLVHDYIEVDDGIVLERLANLADLDDFVAVVAAWVVPPVPPRS